MRTIPKESELSSNISRLTRVKCITQTWITESDGSKHRESSVFRNLSLKFGFDNEALVPLAT